MKKIFAVITLLVVFATIALMGDVRPTYAASSLPTCPIDGKAIDPAKSKDLLGVVGLHHSLMLMDDEIAASYKEAGVKYVRVFYGNWKTIEPERGQYNWEGIEDRLASIRKYGLEPVLVVASTPKWASSRPDDPNYQDYPPSDIQDWKNFIRTLVKRYGKNGENFVRIWNIWNEPDQSTFKGTPKEYVQLLNAAYAVIKDEDSQAQVWAPSVTQGDLIKYLNNEPNTFFGETIAKGKFDVVTFHSYRTLDKSYEYVKKSREKLNNLGMSNFDLIVTETNLPGPAMGKCPYRLDCSNVEGLCVTETQQASELKNRFACLASAGAKTVFWYNSMDYKASLKICPDGVNRAGLFRMDLTRKPSYEALKQIGSVINPTGSPIPTPTPTPTPKLGDLNSDGKVDILDYKILIADFGKTGTPGWIPADIIQNGKVDIFDYNILVGNFGK